MPGQPPSGDELLSTILNLLLVALLVAAMVSSILAPQRRRSEEKLKVYTRVECMKCGYSYTRLFKNGDYVGAPAGKCPKCGSEMIISGVYEERVERQRRVGEA